MEGIVLRLVQILLVKHAPIHIKGPDSSIFDSKDFVDGRSICNCRGHIHRGVHRVVVETNLVGRHDNGRASDGDPAREFNLGQPLDLSADHIIELATNVVEDRHSNWYIGVSRKLSLVWSENDRNTFIVLEEEILLLFEHFCH